MLPRAAVFVVARPAVHHEARRPPVSPNQQWKRLHTAQSAPTKVRIARVCVCVCVRCCFASQLACMLDGVRYPDTASWSVADWIDELRITRNHHQHSNNCGVKPSVLRDTVRLVTGCIAALSRLKGLPPADAQALSKLVRACCM